MDGVNRWEINQCRNNAWVDGCTRMHIFTYSHEEVRGLTEAYPAESKTVWRVGSVRVRFWWRVLLVQQESFLPPRYPGPLFLLLQPEAENRHSLENDGDHNPPLLPPQTPPLQPPEPPQTPPLKPPEPPQTPPLQPPQTSPRVCVVYIQSESKSFDNNKGINTISG